jgi:hypothetical protein
MEAAAIHQRIGMSFLLLLPRAQFNCGAAARFPAAGGQGQEKKAQLPGTKGCAATRRFAASGATV